jgi:hypothetical protein
MEDFEERILLEATGVMSTKTSSRQKTAAKTALLLFSVFGGQIVLQSLMNKGAFQTKTDSFIRKKKYRAFVIPPPSSHDEIKTASYTISNDVRKEYEQWHMTVRNLSQMTLQQPKWKPPVNWTNHPRDRSHRFPSVEERVQYYMGKWFNTTVAMYGRDFERSTFIQRKTTREFGPFADILVNLYNLNKAQLLDCYKNKKELHVISPYCRDYIDIGILNSMGSANVIHYIGDGLPAYVPEEIKKYPMFGKVRRICSYEGCKKSKIEPILLPLNRKRHFGVASIVPKDDISYEEKTAKAVWRGKLHGKVHDTMIDTNDIKFSLVSMHFNSTIVDAKFSKRTKGVPVQMTGAYLDLKDQLKYKYIISIEGNDVSSGLKWMLLSNSVVLMPKPTWESWAMEARLEPFVHYIPIRSDMSNVEEMLRWAEDHPEKTRMIAERSSLFIYDLLFHPQAIKDEQSIMISIMERFEINFGSVTEERRIKHSPINDKTLRFPSVEERVKYIMHDWYQNTSSVHIEPTTLHTNSVKNYISNNELFIASGQQLSFCAMSNSSFSVATRQFCKDSLPEFDERVTADLKSNSFATLLTSEKGDKIRLAPFSSWRTDTTGVSRESKRVLLNEVTKILYFGDDPCKTSEIPFFTSSRGSGDCIGNGILWPFGFDSARDLVKSDQMEQIDIDFDLKQPTKFIATGSLSKTREGLRDILSNRYLVKAENDAERSTDDLLVMILSKSVVLMSEKPQTTSWLMESYLKPYVHFVPVNFADPSDLDRKIMWCEQNLDEARKISERATQYAYDITESDKDDEEVRFRVMERYTMLYGSNRGL